MEGFLDLNFPTNICKFYKSSCEFFTIVQQAKNGKENRVILNSTGRNKFIHYGGVIKKSESETLFNFFKIVKGRGLSFRFFDENENIAENEPLKHIQNNIFQLCKTYSYQSYEDFKHITKPIENTLILQCDEEILLSNQDYNLEKNTGIITIINPNFLENANKIKAFFSYDLEARFEQDELKTTKDKFGNILLEEIIICEVA